MKILSFVFLSFFASAAIADMSPVVPFVIPSGRPDEHMVRGIVSRLDESGFDQFMIYPSTGVEYEYLSEEYLRMVGWFLDEAESRKMYVWLYDEFNWPSGTCRGRVPAENEECLFRELVACTNSEGRIAWQIVVNRGVNVDNDCLDTNNLEPASANRFMELTHFLYERRFKRYMGSVIRGMFTDEPGHCTGAWQMKMPQGAVTRIPWWSGMEEEYASASGGRSFRSDYETAFSCGDLSGKFPFQIWTQIRSERYRKTFFDPIRRWCGANGIVSTGHMIGEHEPPKCARDNGSPINTLLGIGKPGIDLVISATDRRFEWVTLALVQAAARRCGRTGSAELFGLGPCDMDFATMRKLYWICALHKVDTFFQGLWHRTAVRFKRKPAWAMFTSPSQPWFSESKLLNEAAREAAVWATKTAKCDIALVYPQKVMGACAMAGVEAPDLVAACRELTWNGFNYDLVEETETVGHDVILDWDGHSLFERRSGTRFAGLEEMIGYLERRFPSRICVRDGNGKPKGGYVVRSYADGSAVAVDVQSGEVRFASGGAFVESKPLPSRELADKWELALDGPSRRRIWFWTSSTEGYKPMPWDKETKVIKRVRRYAHDNTASFRVLEPVKGVRFVLRAMPGDSDVLVTLNGKPLLFDQTPATALVYAYNDICRQSAPVDLAPGKYTLSLKGARDDKMFLPVLWMTGEFSEPERGAIATLPSSIGMGSLYDQSLPSFAGTAVYRARVRFEKGESLLLDTGGAVARVSIDGCDMGSCGWPPFGWKIPESMSEREVVLEISLTTSIRPIFGYESDPDACLGHAQWIKSLTHDPPIVGLRSCRAVVRK